MSRKTNEEISNIIFQDNICCCLPPPSFALTTNEKRQSHCFLFRFSDPIYFLVIFFYVKMKYKFSKQNVPSPPRKNASHTVSISDLNDLIYFHEILCSHFCYGFENRNAGSQYSKQCETVPSPSHRIKKNFGCSS